MRDDMSKVLVEKPRGGLRSAYDLRGTRRKWRNRIDRDGESAPLRYGIRRDAKERKGFGENLNPLYRYLSKQIHRPWAKVYSELSAHIDRRNTVQEHLFQHIDDRVAIRTIWRDGRVLAHRYGRTGPLEECGAELFVHPLTGILLPNRAAAGVRQRWKEACCTRKEAPNPDLRMSLPGMSIDRQWHRVKGIWYEVSLCLLEAGPEAAPVYDVVLGRLVNRDSKKLLTATYGYNDVYAWSKRQLPGKTLRKHGLESQSG